MGYAVNSALHRTCLIGVGRDTSVYGESEEGLAKECGRTLC